MDWDFAKVMEDEREGGEREIQFSYLFFFFIPHPSSPPKKVDKAQ